MLLFPNSSIISMFQSCSGCPKHPGVLPAKELSCISVQSPEQTDVAVVLLNAGSGRS